MYCDEPAEPECRTEDSDEEQDLQDKGTSCENIGGTYLEEFDECEGISEDGCAALGGTFDPCGSACRNDPDAEFCTMQCVPFCSFS